MNGGKAKRLALALTMSAVAAIIWVALTQPHGEERYLNLKDGSIRLVKKVAFGETEEVIHTDFSSLVKSLGIETEGDEWVSTTTTGQGTNSPPRSTTVATHANLLGFLLQNASISDAEKKEIVTKALEIIRSEHPEELRAYVREVDSKLSKRVTEKTKAE